MEDSTCLKMGKYTLRLELEETQEELFVRTAREELRETPELKKEALEKLKILLKENGIVVPLDEDEDTYLTSILRATKYYENSALERIKYMCNFQIKHPKYFSNVVPETAKTAYLRNLLTVLPRRDQYGRRILIVHAGNRWKPSQCSLLEVLRAILLTVQSAILEPKTQIAGSSIILDMEGMQLLQAWQFSAGFAKMVLDWIQNSMPLRLKAIHVVRQPRIFEMVFAVFKPFMREKIRNRILFHGDNPQSLFEHIDEEFIPACLGGTLDISLEQGQDIWNYLSNFDKKHQKISKIGFVSGKWKR